MVVDNEVNSDGELVHFAMLADSEPVTYLEALKNEKWKQAMIEELESIKKNGTWTLTTLPKGKKAISVKWVFKLKLDPKGKIAKYKARLVARGFQQKHGIDYEEVFAPVARHETIRLVIALACSKGWDLHHLDVKSAFLNGTLDETVYISQPPGFEKKGGEHLVCHLHKALYGLKQAPRAWNKRIDTFFIESGFTKCTNEFGVYVKGSLDTTMLLICLYVDDLLVTGTNAKEIECFKESMKAEFEMTDLGDLTYFLGMEFLRIPEGIILHQHKYSKELLTRFDMAECNSATNPAEGYLCKKEGQKGSKVDPTYFRQIVGSLRYLCHTRPDILFATGMISRFMNEPLEIHLNAAKRVLRYIQGTLNYGLLFPKGSNPNSFELLGFSDSDWCGDHVDRRSTSGFLFKFQGISVSWSSRKQQIVALSSCEAEYVAACSAATQAAWLEALLQELGIKLSQAPKILIDNKSTLCLAKNPMSHGRTKHIETRYHYLRDQVIKGRLIVDYCNTKEQQADIFTKAIKGELFTNFRRELGIVAF